MKARSTKYLILSAVVAVSLGMAKESQAAGDSGAWVGGNLGMMVPNAPNTTARPGFGINGGAKLGSEYGIGGYYMSSKKDETVGSSTISFGYDLYGVMFGYFFEGDAKGVYLGGMLGMSKVTWQTTVSSVKVDASASPMHWGVVAGYDNMLGSNFSIGGEFNYISIASSTSVANSASSSIDAFASLNFLANMKLWF